MNDGEARTEKLIKISTAPPWEGLDGIAYRDGKGRLIKIPSDILNGHFEVLPYPDRRLINMERCFEIGRPYAPFNNDRRTAHVAASKGCPLDCIFCAAVGFVGHNVHLRPIESLKAEFKDLAENFGVEEIQFMDDNLTIKKISLSPSFRNLKDGALNGALPTVFFQFPGREYDISYGGKRVLSDHSCY